MSEANNKAGLGDAVSQSDQDIRQCALLASREAHQNAMYRLGWERGVKAWPRLTFGGDALTARERRDYTDGHDDGLFFVCTIRPPSMIQERFDVGELPRGVTTKGRAGL